VGGALVTTGVVIGGVLSLLVTRQLSQLLFETGAGDPLVYGLSVLVLATTGMVACLLPAIRASRLDPRMALSVQ
jgi:putative ABC transport system permease protein